MDFLDCCDVSEGVVGEFSVYTSAVIDDSTPQSPDVRFRVVRVIVVQSWCFDPDNAVNLELMVKILDGRAAKLTLETLCHLVGGPVICWNSIWLLSGEKCEPSFSGCH